MKQLCIFLAVLFFSACQTLPTSTEWQARGDAYLKDGKKVKALQAYNKALRLNPENPSVYASRGAAYFFLGEYELAEQDFNKVLQINPHQADVYTALGSALAAQGKYEESLPALERGVILQPNKAEGWFALGGVYFMLQQYEQAVQYYSQVLQLRPAGDVYRARAAAYMKLGNSQAAEQDLKAAASPLLPQQLNEYRMIE